MIYKRISQLANMQRRLIDKLAKEKQYSGTEGKVIHFLFENSGKPVYQKNIESVFALRAATATQVLDSLEKQELIERVPSKEDKRLKEIVLTKKADKLKDDIFHDLDQLESQIVRGLSEAQLHAWCEITNQMIQNLQEE